MHDVQNGAAQLVQISNQSPGPGPAIPVAVVTTGAVLGGPYQPVVEVTDNRPRLGGAAIPVTVGIGSGVAVAGPPMPVYVVSGSLTPHGASILMENSGYILLETGDRILLE